MTDTAVVAEPRLDVHRFLQILREVAYRDWDFQWRPVHTALGKVEGWLVWASFVDHEGVHWNTRKWYISQHMTESEVVQTVLLLVLVAEEHEIRESFKYRQKALFGPHIAVGAHLEAADTLDVR